MVEPPDDRGGKGLEGPVVEPVFPHRAEEAGEEFPADGRIILAVLAPLASGQAGPQFGGPDQLVGRPSSREGGRRVSHRP